MKGVKERSEGPRYKNVWLSYISVHFH